jgi:Thymidylate synthase complementing protein
MTQSAKIITDSISLEGIRLITMELHYPKFIHGELMTHRVLSRNASSSRAIPVERLIQDVMDDPVIPIHWGVNRPGMQAHDVLEEEQSDIANTAWTKARDSAVAYAREMARIGLHKQLVNRIIEPWCHIRVVVTATEWGNFFLLRRHPDAQPEMRALADAMWEAQQVSTPTLLKPGGWHLPYVTNKELDILGGVTGGEPFEDDWTPFIKLSVARCARVSYLTHDGKSPDVAADLALYDRLVGAVPLHASPTEHQALPDAVRYKYDDVLYWKHRHEHGNLVGWRQYRKMLPNEAGGTRS